MSVPIKIYPPSRNRRKLNNRLRNRNAAKAKAVVESALDHAMHEPSKPEVEEYKDEIGVMLDAHNSRIRRYWFVK